LVLSATGSNFFYKGVVDLNLLWVIGISLVQGLVIVSPILLNVLFDRVLAMVGVKHE